MGDNSAGKLRRLGTLALVNRASTGARTESASSTEAAGADSVSSEIVKNSVAALQEHITRVRGGSGRVTEGDRALLEAGRSAGAKLVGDGAAAHLSRSEEAALEAIAAADGSRPALLLCEDSYNKDDPTIGDWADKLRRVSAALKLASQSVGRIDIDGRHVGTGWIVRPGFVATNRHVAQVLSKEPKERALALDTQYAATICFGYQVGETAPPAKHLIDNIVFAGEDYIDPLVANMADLDLAILKLGHGREATPMPLPSSLLPVAETIPAKEIFVLGYPGPASGSQLPESVLLTLLGSEAGLKRLSPGEIAVGPGGVAGDTKSRTIAHDATTLGGSSGSAILGFDAFGNPLVLGLHFGGYEVRYGPGGVTERRGRNFAHSFAAMDDVIIAVDAAIAKFH